MQDKILIDALWLPNGRGLITRYTERSARSRERRSATSPIPKANSPVSPATPTITSLCLSPATEKRSQPCNKSQPQTFSCFRLRVSREVRRTGSRTESQFFRLWLAEQRRPFFRRRFESDANGKGRHRADDRHQRARRTDLAADAPAPAPALSLSCGPEERKTAKLTSGAPTTTVRISANSLPAEPISLLSVRPTENGSTTITVRTRT